MHQNTSSTFQPFSYEGIAGRKMLYDISVLVVVYVNSEMLVTVEQSIIERKGYDGEHVGNVGSLQGPFSFQGEKAGSGVRACSS